MPVNDNHLLWVDLETTGSDPTKDCIIEVGAILTDQDLNVLGEYSELVAPTEEGLGRLMMNPTVRRMHEANGLLEELLDLSATPPRRVHHVSAHLVHWADDLGARRGRTILAGSGVGHFDRRFIAKWMPLVDKFLRYWCIDIGVVRRAHEMWADTPLPSDADTRKTHRALDDIRCHLEEAKAFRTLWVDGLDIEGVAA